MNLSLGLNAVSRILKGVPDYLSKPTADTSPSPSKLRKRVHDRSKAEQDAWINLTCLECTITRYQLLKAI